MSSVGLHSSPATAEELLGEADAQSAPNGHSSAAPAPVEAIEAASVGAASAAPAKPASSSKDSSQASPKRPYPAPAELPTQRSPKGLRFDFNDGCRVVLPESEQPWRVRLSDLDTGNILFETELKAGRVNSTKRYFVRFRLEVWHNGESLLVHDYSAAGSRGADPVPGRHARRHDRLVSLCGEVPGAPPLPADLRHGRQADPAVSRQPIRRSLSSPTRRSSPSATTRPTASACSSTTRTASSSPATSAMSGCTAPPATSSASIRPRCRRASRSPTTAGRSPSPMSASRCRARPRANTGTIPTAGARSSRFLKEAGYRVICIDQKPTHGTGLIWNHIPNGAEDETGDRPLQERARWLKHAEFFVGLSSGLSWLAWAAGTPVVMISGFTHPTNEFDTPYRVINYHACNSCWNDVRVPLRPQGLPVVPAPQGHAAPVRMHAADHRRAGEDRYKDNSGIWDSRRQSCSVSRRA